MAKQKPKKKTSDKYDGIFLLKLGVYLILGSLWLKIQKGSGVELALPIGLIAGIAIVSHERFRIDRKIEYAVLLVSALIGFVAPFGLYIKF